MTEPPFQLATCPIVEAVIEIRCDMPAGFSLAALEVSARAAYREAYVKFQRLVLQTHRFEAHAGEPPTLSSDQGLQGLQFFQADRRQLVQITTQGYSFNRLAPYTSLDDYLPEFESTWKKFVAAGSPVMVREVRLRYINRILLPFENGQVEFTKFLKVSPRLPDEDRLQFIGFFNQHTAVEVATGHQVNIVMTMQPREKEHLPLIFDIEVLAGGNIEPGDWERICEKIDQLRALKNHVFKNTLTVKCLNLYSRSES